MKKDPRYKAIQLLIRIGYIQQFRDIFILLPITVLAVDMGMNANRMRWLSREVEQFRLRELDKMAGLIGVEQIDIIRLVMAQRRADKEEKA